MPSLLTRGASGYSSLLGNLSVYVSLARQNPHLAFKTLQYHNMWASYDMFEKTIIRNFAEKASVKRKSLQTLRPFMDIRTKEMDWKHSRDRARRLCMTSCSRFPIRVSVGL